MEQTNYYQEEDKSSTLNSGTLVPKPENKKVVAGIFAILLGYLGVHKFYLGYTKEGVIMLLVSILTCGLGASVMGIIGLIEGIIYLTKTDEDFYNTYQVNKKVWF